ncbi:MAG: dihydroxyacetone kinase family protein, partial [Gemmataceae bacterium]
MSELDSVSGDADHGSNMERGMIAVLAVLGGEEIPRSPTELLKTVGVTIVDRVGGSSGALYGTIFLRMARAIGDKSLIDGDGFAGALRAGLSGVVERGGAKGGDKTMYDALAPAVDALEKGLAEGNTFQHSMQCALAAAEAGRDATIHMTA